MKKNSLMIISTILISVIAWAVFISVKQWWQFGDPDKVYLHAIHLPSLLFILLSWIIAEWLLDFNKTYNKSSAINIEDDEKNLNIIILKIESKDIDKIEEAYNLINSLGGIFEIFKRKRLSGESHQDFSYQFEKYYAARNYELNERASHIGFVSTVLPMLGMIGTLVGLMMMASGLENSDSITSQEGLMQKAFGGLSVALLTTLYASIITITIVRPRLQKLKNEISTYEFHLLSIWKGMSRLFDITQTSVLKENDDDKRSKIIKNNLERESQ